MNQYLNIWLEPFPLNRPLDGVQESATSTAELIYGEWCLLDGDTLVSSGNISKQSDIEELSKLSESSYTTLLLAGEQVTLHWVNLPGSSRDALRTIPYQLETVLLLPVAELSFNPLPKLQEKNGKMPVLVWSESLKDRVQAWIEKVELHTDRVVPDYLLLNLVAGKRKLSESVAFHERVLSFSGQVGGAFNRSLYHQIATTDLSETVASVSLYELTKGTGNDRSVSLIKSRRTVPSGPKRKIVTGLLMLVLFVGLNTAILYVTNQRIERQLTETKEQVSSLFQNLLPGMREVDPVAQVDQLVTQRKSSQQAVLLIQSLQGLSQSVQQSSNDQSRLKKLAFDAAKGEVTMWLVDTVKVDEDKLVRLLSAKAEITLKANVISIKGRE